MTTQSPRAGVEAADPHITGRRRNADFNWNIFDSNRYHKHNYAELRSDDREILVRVRDFLAAEHARQDGRRWRGIDVGPGANLYPSLAMLPFCESIRLHEYSANNVAWLTSQITEGYGSSWDAFWDVLREHPAYRAVDDPRARLRATASVNKDSVFRLPAEDADSGSITDLPRRAWDVGTMFFVAESLTTEHAEFAEAVARFIGALRPGAPFAAAFMRDSAGYRVGDTWFPAVAVTGDDVRQCLRDELSTVDLEVAELGFDASLREGYGGMIVATGRVGDH